MKTKLVRKLFFYGLIFLNASWLVSQQSNVKTNMEYPINDPRNPNCPCHLYQQLANQEYENNVSRIPLKIVLKTSSLQQTSVHLQSDKVLNRGKLTTKLSKKIKVRKRTSAKFIKIRKNKGREKRQRSVGLCYNWI